MKWLSIVLMVFVAIGFWGCDEDSNGNTAYLEALPSAEMLTLSMESGIETRVDTEKSPMREHTDKLMADLNKLLTDTHTSLDSVKNLGQHDSFTSGGNSCHRWTLKGWVIFWKLEVCEESSERYAFNLKGRPVASTDDADYKEVTTGFGTRLPDFESARCGVGFIYYNFDNFGVLTKTQIFGTMGIGYRVAGKVRQLNIGMKNLKAGLMLQSYSALYHYMHKVGKGGIFKYLGEFDLLTTIAGLPVFGLDGKKEIARRVVAWSTKGHARTLTSICGGTIDDIIGYPHKCVVAAHCWKADGTVTLDEIVDGTVNWELCEPLEMTDPLVTPDESELAEPAQVDEVGSMLAIPEMDSDE